MTSNGASDQPGLPFQPFLRFWRRGLHLGLGRGGGEEVSTLLEILVGVAAAWFRRTED